jgi:hypothetical protein
MDGEERVLVKDWLDQSPFKNFGELLTCQICGELLKGAS